MILRSITTIIVIIIMYIYSLLQIALQYAHCSGSCGYLNLKSGYILHHGNTCCLHHVTMTSKRTKFCSTHFSWLDLEVPSALQRWNELKLIDTICVSTKFLFHRFPKKKHVPYISIAVSLFKSMIKLCKSGFVATLSADLVLRSRHRWCPLSNWRSSSRLKKLLVCFDTQEKTIILLKSACDSGVSTKKWREDTRPNETSKFTCYCGMGKTAWLAKLQSVLMLCMQCPLFTPTLRPAKSKETKPTTKKLVVCLNLSSWKHQALQISAVIVFILLQFVWSLPSVDLSVLLHQLQQVLLPPVQLDQGPQVISFCTAKTRWISSKRLETADLWWKLSCKI